jgi:hypothetical protein
MFTLICGRVDVHGLDVYLFFLLMNLLKKGCWGFLPYGFPEGKTWCLLCLHVYVMHFLSTAFTIMLTIYCYTAHMFNVVDAFM